MGFKQTDLVPFNITTNIPAGKDHLIKLMQVSRTDTVASVKMVFPAAASLYRIYFNGGTNSDAGTTATVTLTVANNTGTVSTGTVDVKANGTTSAIIQMSNLPLIEPLPLQGDYTVTAVYAETGTASTAGGPWKIAVEYIS